MQQGEIPPPREFRQNPIIVWAIFVGIALLLGVGICTPSWSSSADEPTSQLSIGGHEFANMTKVEFEQRMRSAGLSEDTIQRSLANFETDQKQARLWQEQWEHWGKMDNITSKINEVLADGVVDLDEALLACVAFPQWERDLRAANGYLERYAAFDRETIGSEASLLRLREAVDEGLTFVNDITQRCSEF